MEVEVEMDERERKEADWGRWNAAFGSGYTFNTLHLYLQVLDFLYCIDIILHYYNH